eukprot:jgi/Tetstr1/454256/TSEL_041175.t1
MPRAQKGGASARKARLVWTPDLKARFDQAVADLGGLEDATPTRIKEKMQTDLTIHHIKSRLQKLRLEQQALSWRETHRKRAQAGAAPPAAPGASGQRRTFDDAFPPPASAPRTVLQELSSQLDDQLASAYFFW